MVTKKLGLGILALLSVFLLVSCALTAETLVVKNAAGVEVTDAFPGETVTLHGVEYDKTSEDYYIKFDNVKLSDVTVNISDDEELTTSNILLPTKTAGAYSFEVLDIEGTPDDELDDTVVSDIAFDIKNAAPEVKTASLPTAFIGEEYINKKIEVFDANGDDMTCTLASKDGLNIGITKTEDSEKHYCELSFTTVDKKPTKIGMYSVKLDVTDNSADPKTTQKTFDLQIKDYLEITDVEIDDKTGDNDHMPGDEIKVIITIENNNDEDIEDIEIELENDDLNIDETLDEFDLDAGDDDKITFTFNIPYDIDEGPHTISITAKGEDADTPHTERKAEYEISMSINKDKHALIITNVVTDKEKSSCGDAVYLSFDVINAGREDEENIDITIKSVKLGLDKAIETLDSLDVCDSKSFSDVKVNIPDAAYDGTFIITIKAKSDGTSGTETKLLILEDCEASLFSVTPESVIFGPGKEAIISISIENIGLLEQSYELRISGIDDFGTYNLSVDDEEDIDIESGKTKEIALTITANSDAEVKDYDVEIEVYLGSDEIASKAVKITVERASWLSGLAVFGGGGDTGLTIGIVIAIALIAYLAYQIWLKRSKTNGLDELDKEEDKSSIIFEDEKSSKPKKGSKKRPKKKK